MPDDAVQPRRPDVRPRGPSMHASCSRGASLCRQAATSTRLLTASASLTTRPPPCTRSYLGSCSSGNDELARPSRAADDAARSERVCRCSRQSRVFTLDEAGGKGVVCSCVAAVDVLGHLSAAMWQARLVGTLQTAAEVSRSGYRLTDPDFPPDPNKLVKEHGNLLWPKAARDHGRRSGCNFNDCLRRDFSASP